MLDQVAEQGLEGLAVADLRPLGRRQVVPDLVGPQVQAEALLGLHEHPQHRPVGQGVRGGQMGEDAVQGLVRHGRRPAPVGGPPGRPGVTTAPPRCARCARPRRRIACDARRVAWSHVLAVPASAVSVRLRSWRHA